MKTVKVSLWTGKCCVAPVKLTTVPRLELLACILLSKLIVSVKKTVAGLLTVGNVIWLVRFADFAVVDQTDSERLEGLCQKSNSGYSKKCNPRVLNVRAN